MEDFFSNSQIRNVVSALLNVVKTDVENDNLALMLSNVVQLNIKKYNVVPTLTYTMLFQRWFDVVQSYLQNYWEWFPLVNFNGVHSISKEVPYLPWQNKYSTLKSACHVKPNGILSIKLPENQLFVKYLIFVYACNFNFRYAIFQYPSQEVFYSFVLLFNLDTESKILTFVNTNDICYNHFHYILSFFVVLPNFPFNTSETMRDYYL